MVKGVGRILVRKRILVYRVCGAHSSAAQGMSLVAATANTGYFCWTKSYNLHELSYCWHGHTNHVVRPGSTLTAARCSSWLSSRWASLSPRLGYTVSDRRQWVKAARRHFQLPTGVLDQSSGTGRTCTATPLAIAVVLACSGVKRICCEEGQRLKLCHEALTVDFGAECSSWSMTNNFCD